ncbi:NnrS family protein [Halomonas vilamensis]|uniref:NnrS family protein n=1 Tax=Vreelandella vilamensis TaxID=531309 RepID=A0ABU1H886_9GAMM|nr:NnrS family protein [Halomonas vilamensis]MDR5899892.1 NnrS family protein [Halomonas vilamensis]
MSDPAPPQHVPLLRLAFRPFFLIGALFSVLAMLVWLGFWHGNLWITPYGGMLWWHQHEMLFGFASAVITGFLLTAVQNWTGRPSLSGGPLLALVALWLAARLLLAYAVLPGGLLLLVDVAFLPLVAYVMAQRVVAVRMWRNLLFVPVLLLLTLANAAMHWGAMQGDALLIREAGHLAIFLITTLMVVVGGRVIPFFTANTLGFQKPEPRRVIEQLTLGAMSAVVLLQTLITLSDMRADTLLATLLMIAAGANAWRLAHWRGWLSVREPLLWGLHLSYAFIPLGLLLWAWQLFTGQRVETALHALAIGSIGTMMLAMMARVSLGHTGRVIRTLPGIGLALVGLVLAALLRSVWLWLFPQSSHWVYSVVIILWCLSYFVFVLHYSVPLLSARADGKNG